MSLQGPASTPPQRDPITTHVLDSTTGKPAANIKVTLVLHANPKPGVVNPTWTATTSASDGRINQWQGNISLRDLIENSSAKSGTTSWSLKFDTGAYWGPEKTFYPEVEIKFFRRPGEAHYHVPLLLGPWGYTTYRGS